MAKVSRGDGTSAFAGEGALVRGALVGSNALMGPGAMVGMPKLKNLVSFVSGELKWQFSKGHSNLMTA